MEAAREVSDFFVSISLKVFFFNEVLTKSTLLFATLRFAEVHIASSQN